MSWFWVIVITGGSVICGISICFYLLRHCSDVGVGHWWLEHIVCPIIRILVLLVIVSLIYPVISIDEYSSGMGSLEFWRILLMQNHINHLINVLFFGGLLLSFIPLINHPVFALPILSCLSIALVFNWQFSGQLDTALSLLPAVGDILIIVVYMAIAYFVTRDISIRLSEWLDKLLSIEGSLHLLADAIYLVLQIPVISMYCSFLRNQLPAVTT